MHVQNLGKTITAARERKGLTLRDVERETGVSNAYLSQLENAKIKAPSPNVLHKLAELYEVPYTALMAAAGYPVESAAIPSEAVRLAARLGPTSSDEEDALADYLEFIRRRKSGPR
jgi:HTH-type transcriptional regulator, competence development regulator